MVIEIRQYTSRQKLLHKMKEICGVISGKTSSGWNPAFKFIFTYMYIFCHTFIGVR